MELQKCPSINGHQTISPTTDNPKSPTTQCLGSGTLPANIGISKQISKLKRFLSTLLSFGNDMDSSIGENVKDLVYSLLCNKISIEQFQIKLQQTTHFPLKAFVTPFLKATLPLLQQEIVLCSQLVHQTPENFLLHNREYLASTTSNKSENIFENTKNFGLEVVSNENKDVDLSSSPEILVDSSNNFPMTFISNNKKHLKRSLSVKIESEANDSKPKDPVISPKNSTAIPFWKPSLVTVANFNDRLENMDSILQSSLNQSLPSTMSYVNSTNNLSFIDAISWAKNKSFTDKLHQHWDQLLSHISNFQPSLPYRVTPFQFPVSEFEIISGLEEIIKFQEEHQKNLIQQLRNMQETIRRQREDSKLSDFLHGSSNSNDLMNIKRCAIKYYDDAVQEVQRVVQLELRKTIKSLQDRTIELIDQEKNRFHFIIKSIRRQYKEEYTKLLTKQDEGPENCHNCGRKASEACSGCQITRYCGRFCQQKDWNKHKTQCGQFSAPLRKISKIENFENSSNSSTTSIQTDPENLSLKSFPDLSNILKYSQTLANKSSQSLQMEGTSLNHDHSDETSKSDDDLKIDV